MSEKVTIYYRTYAGENNAPRPDWYSKELCLNSFLVSLQLLRESYEADLYVLHDGPLSENEDWALFLKTEIEPIGEIIEDPKQGNSKSCLKAIEKGAIQGEEEIVIFSEDDYLWLTPALIGMVNALTNLPADYVTAYDHPVRYQPDYPLGADYLHWHNDIHITKERHWRSQESTCMSFGAKAGVLAKDMDYFVKYHDNGKGRPEDRELFRELQGLGEYKYKDTVNPRLLLGPIPSLNTHVHLPWLAPVIEWDDVARDLLSEDSLLTD